MTHTLGLISARETNNSPCNLLFLRLPFLIFLVSGKLIFRRVSGFHKLPSLRHNISSRCVMWEVVLMLSQTCFYRRSQKQYYKMQQSVSHAPNHLSLWQPAISFGAHPLSMLTRQVWRTAGPVLPALAAMSNTRQLASEHSSWGSSASWEIQMGICLLKLLVGCLLFLPALKEQPVIAGIP